MELKDKEGKPIDTTGLDDKVVKVLTSAFGGITPQLASTVQESIKPLSEKLDALDTDKLTEVIEKVGKIGESGKEGEGENTTPKSDDPAVQAILSKLEELTKKQEEFENKSQSEREASAASARTQGYIEKHFPNLKGKEVIIARISATKPKDDDAVKAAFDKERNELEAILGKDAVEKQFSADSSGEGGKHNEPDNEEAEAKAKIEAMEAELPKA
ncbi:MAG: hypothetical protein JJ916_10410 [Phycisphaerales bacterium]|nr:hypothetical protein [Phycisphaerales bacterium]